MTSCSETKLGGWGEKKAKKDFETQKKLMPIQTENSIILKYILL